MTEKGIPRRLSHGTTNPRYLRYRIFVDEKTLAGGRDFVGTLFRIDINRSNHIHSIAIIIIIIIVVIITYVNESIIIIPGWDCR